VVVSFHDVVRCVALLHDVVKGLISLEFLVVVLSFEGIHGLGVDLRKLFLGLVFSLGLAWLLYFCRLNLVILNFLSFCRLN